MAQLRGVTATVLDAMVSEIDNDFMKMPSSMVMVDGVDAFLRDQRKYLKKRPDNMMGAKTWEGRWFFTDHRQVIGAVLGLIYTMENLRTLLRLVVVSRLRSLLRSTV